MNDVDGVNEGKFGRVLVGLSGGSVHLRANPKVGQEQAKKVLTNQIGQLAPQDQLPFGQMFFDLCQGGLDGPSLLV